MEALRERKAVLDAQYRELKLRRSEYEKIILESEAVAKELNAKAQECARHRDIQNAQLAESAKAFVARYARVLRRRRSGESSAAASAVERSERKLELKLNMRVRGFFPMEWPLI